MSTAAIPQQTGRSPVVITTESAIDLVEPGMTIGIGGFINAGHPMALVRELIRRKITDLTVVGAASSGLEIDMLIASGCVRKLISPYVGAEGLAGIGPAFRRAAQKQELQMWELDEAHFYAALRAAAQRVPFNPWRAGVGTSYPELNPEFKEFRDPVNNELLLAIPAVNLDIAFLHASLSDAYGNVQHHGSGYGDRAIHAAADITVVEVERIVSNEQIRSSPASTSIAGATHVVRAPFGAHPFGSEGWYPVDSDHIRRYVDAARRWLQTDDRAALDEYFDTYVDGCKDHFDYLEAIGLRHLLSLSEH